MTPKPAEPLSVEQVEGIRALCDLALSALRQATEQRVLFHSDSYCPKCGHNRDKSSTSSIDNEDGTNTCQICETTWREIAK